MKRVLILSMMMFLVTGCTLTKMTDVSEIEVVNDIIDNDVSLKNRVGLGYSYYMPAGVSLLEVNDDNEVLYANGSKYYLYLDLISYQKQVVVEYKGDDSLYLAQAIRNGNEYGYLQIEKVDDQYFVEMMYNYAKIETYIYEYQLEDTVINLSYILASVTYNDSIIDSLIEDRVITANGSSYNIFKPSSVDNSYMENIEEDLTDTSSAIDDPDVIDINPNE